MTLNDLWPYALIILGTLAANILFPGISAYLNGLITGQARNQKLQNAVAIDTLQRAGVTRERLEVLEREYFRPKAKERERADAIKAEVEIEGKWPTQTTQAELNQYADTLARIAENKMELSYQELLASIGQNQRDEFEKAQKEWRRFARLEASAVSSKYEGGSRRPLAFSMTLEDLYVERAASLQQHLHTMNEEG